MNILHEMGRIYDKHCHSCSMVPRNKHGQRHMSWCENNCEYGALYKKLGDEYLKRLSEKRGKRMLTKEKYIALKEDGLTDKKIMDRTNTNHNKLNALKKEWGLIGKPGKPVNISKAAAIDDESFIHIDKYNHVKAQLEKTNAEIKRLNHIIDEKGATIETIIGASEKAVEENEMLKKEIEDLKELLKQPVENDDEIELIEENNALRQCLKMVL